MHARRGCFWGWLAAMVAAAMATAQAQFNEWEVTLGTTGLPSAEFVFGARTGATLGYDQGLEPHLPPPLPDGWLGGFRVNGTQSGSLLSNSFHPVGLADGIWEFEMDVPAGLSVVWRWDAPAAAAAPARLAILDDRGEEIVVDLALAESHTFEIGGKGLTRVFIVLGTATPKSNDDSLQMLKNGVVDIDVLANDFFPAGSIPDIVDLMPGADTHGTVFVETDLDGYPFVRYTPDTGFGGTAIFTYKTSSGLATSAAAATVTVRVNQHVALQAPAPVPPATPGEPYTIAIGVNADPAVTDLSVSFVLPATAETPPTLWSVDPASLTVQGAGVGNPALVDNGDGTAVIHFNGVIPTSFSFDLLPPYRKMNATPLIFSRIAGTVGGNDAFEENSLLRLDIPVRMPLTVVVQSASRPYGQANPPSFDLAYDGFFPGDSVYDLALPPVATTLASQGSPAGDYPILASGGSDGFYTFIYVPGTLTVTPAPLACRAVDLARPYGQANPELAIAYDGLRNGDPAPAVPPTADCQATAASPVGQYPITLAGGADPNYTLTLADGTLTVTPAPLACRADNVSRLYGDANPEFTVTVMGFVNGEDESVVAAWPVASCEADATSPAGTYPIAPTGGTAPNYAFEYVNGVLTVLAGGRLKLWVDTGDGNHPLALEFGEAETAREDFDAWDTVATPGQPAHLFCPFVTVPEQRRLSRDFRPLPADGLARWRLELAEMPLRGTATLTWNVAAADPTRELWLQALVDERPAGFPLDLKAVGELAGVEPGTVFEIVYGTVRTHTVVLRRGWNAVGTPLLGLASLGELGTPPEGAGLLLPGWRWGADGFELATVDAPFLPETGYLLLCVADSATLEVVGLPADGLFPLAAGWNLLSPVGPMAPPAVRSPGTAAWRWDSASQSHRPAATFEPGQAYWWHGESEGTAGGKPAAGQLLRSTRGRDLAPAAADLGALVDGNIDFALALYHAWRGEEGNLFLSPHSISTALAMTYAGARGETAEQMAAALRFGLPAERLHAAFNALDLELASRGEGAAGSDGQPFRLRVVNQLWGERTYSFLPPFLDTLAEHYGAGLRVLDFVGAAEPARLAINDWVAYQTEQRIRDLLPQGSITSLTRLVLTNAVYFNAAWQSPFPIANTSPGPFTRLDGTQTQAPMMRQTANFPAQVGANWTAVELPYDGDELSMMLLVPDPGAFADFEQKLTAARLNAVLAGLGPRLVELTLPTFEYSCQASLKAFLAQLGMPLAFSEAADFSGMDGTRELLISDVVHQAFVKVNEQGTEAAAATGVVAGVTSAPEPLTLTVDRPFLFLIRDRATGAILFLGRVAEPQ